MATESWTDGAGDTPCVQVPTRPVVRRGLSQFCASGLAHRELRASDLGQVCHSGSLGSIGSHVTTGCRPGSSLMTNLRAAHSASTLAIPL